MFTMTWSRSPCRLRPAGSDIWRSVTDGGDSAVAQRAISADMRGSENLGVHRLGRAEEVICSSPDMAMASTRQPGAGAHEEDGQNREQPSGLSNPHSGALVAKCSA